MLFLFEGRALMTKAYELLIKKVCDKLNFSRKMEEIAKDDLVRGEKIGQGAYGLIYR